MKQSWSGVSCFVWFALLQTLTQTCVTCVQLALSLTECGESSYRESWNHRPNIPLCLKPVRREQNPFLIYRSVSLSIASWGESLSKVTPVLRRAWMKETQPRYNPASVDQTSFHHLSAQEILMDPVYFVNTHSWCYCEQFVITSHSKGKKVCFHNLSLKCKDFTSKTIFIFFVYGSTKIFEEIT